MITMEVTWVGNVYQKFENMCLEVEEMIYEDTVKYLEDQVQTVGASVKKLYEDVLQDLLPPSSCDLDEMVVSELARDQDNDIEVHKKPFLSTKERPAKLDIKQTSKVLRINHDTDNDVSCAAPYDKSSCEANLLFTSASGNSTKGNKVGSHARQRARITRIKSNLGINENSPYKKKPPTKTLDKITSTETETCRTSSYEDVLQDLLPPSSCDLDEMVVSELARDQDNDIEVHKKPFLGTKERPAKLDIKQTSKVLRINHDTDNDVICAAPYDKSSCEANLLFTSASGNSTKGNKVGSHARQRARITRIKSNLGINENSPYKKKPPTKTLDKITSTETETCRTSSCEVLNENHEVPCHCAAAVSNPSLADVTLSNLLADFCSEIENASATQVPDVPIFVKSAEEKEKNVSPSSSDILSGEPNGFSKERVIQSDDFSHSTVILSHPDAWDLDETTAEKGHETMQQDDELKLEETCVMVSGDELRLVPKAGSNLRPNKKKMRQAFTLRKKSGRRQEYEQLAVWHGNSEKGKGDGVETSISTCAVGDHEKQLLSTMSEPEWELL